MLKPLGDPYQVQSSHSYEFLFADKEKLEMLWRKVGEIIEEINKLEEDIAGFIVHLNEPKKSMTNEVAEFYKNHYACMKKNEEEWHRSQSPTSEDLDKSLTHSRPEPETNPPTKYPTSSTEPIE